jgi:hypothetical protein
MTIRNQNQDTIAAAVLSAAFKTKAVDIAKKSMADGSEVSGEITVRIPFRLTKGFASEMAPTASVLSKATLAKALVYSGITAEAFKAALLKAATEALSNDHTVAEELRHDPRVSVMIAELDSVIEQMPKTKKSGSVSVKVLTADGLPVIEQFEIDGEMELEVAA